MRTTPRLTADQFDLYYPDSYKDHQDLAGHDSRINRARWDGIVRWGPYRSLAPQARGTLLDVGCGRGELACAFRRRGWRVCGVEPSRTAAAHASAAGLEVHTGSLDDAPWPDQSFNAIVFNHSLEHIPEPLAALERARALLQPGGVLAISVPNFGCWQRRLFGTSWFQLDLPRHLQHFDRHTLTGLVGRAGFRVEKRGTTPMRAGLPSSIQYRLWGGLRFEGRWSRAALWLLLPALRPLDLVGQGDCLYLIASR